VQLYASENRNVKVGKLTEEDLLELGIPDQVGATSRAGTEETGEVPSPTGKISHFMPRQAASLSQPDPKSNRAPHSESDREAETRWLETKRKIRMRNSLDKLDKLAKNTFARGGTRKVERPLWNVG
jgi:hypothetical protein